MKIIVLFIAVLTLSSFTTPKNTVQTGAQVKVTPIYSSFSLINDTKEKVSIYTGSGFVSLNKGSKTSISCKVGKKFVGLKREKRKMLFLK